MYYIREKEGKNENLKKEGKMRISILISIYTVHFAILNMYTKFENTGSNIGSELVVTCWERADLLALICDVNCVFVTFPCGILGSGVVLDCIDS